MARVNSLTLLLLTAASSALAQSGVLDDSFGWYDGYTTESFAHIDYAEDVTLLPDGRLLVAGTVYSLSDPMYWGFLYRTTALGVPDIAFGGFGMVGDAPLYPITQRTITATALQSDGRVVAVGSERTAEKTGDVTRMMVSRYTPSGQLENLFGTLGHVTVDIPGEWGLARDVTVLNNGKILVAGHSSFVGGHRRIILVRLNSDGTPDVGFGISGRVTTTVNGIWDEVSSMAIQPDGKILLAGHTRTGPGLVENAIALLRYTANGVLDPTFSGDGIVITPLAEGLQSLYAQNDMVLQPDGRIVVLGNPFVDGTPTIGLVRYNSNGSLDTSFGEDGIVLNHPGPVEGLDLYVTGVAQDNAGGLVVCGSTPTAAILVRYLPDGTLDMDFGTEGVVLFENSVTDDLHWKEVVVQPDHRIVVAGHKGLDMIVARYLSGLEVGMNDFSADQESTLIYPNPIAESATLSIDCTSPKTLSCDLVDAEGRITRSLFAGKAVPTGRYQQRLDLRDVAPGSYVLTLNDGTRTVNVQVIKQ